MLSCFARWLRLAIVISANDSKVGTAAGVAYKETSARKGETDLGETVSVSFADSLSESMGTPWAHINSPGGIREDRRIGKHRGK